MWFNSSDLTKVTPIYLPNLHGYVLPHAGTPHTGHIISHTLRFRPSKDQPVKKQIHILYYPSSNTPNIEDTYYHEYYVPWKCIEHLLGNHYHFKGFNLRKNTPHYNPHLPKFRQDTLLVVSADFSHHYPMKLAIELENKAAHSLMFRECESTDYNQIVDDIHSFRTLYNVLPRLFHLQWVGRSRSQGHDKGVGYLSFFIRKTITMKELKYKPPDGMFVTAYSRNMVSRECLGEWFDNNRPWSIHIQSQLIRKVIRSANTTSRLTSGEVSDGNVTHYVITYLFRDHSTKFIRGWHGVKSNAFYLPDVFLEHTYENGTWIQPSDKNWIHLTSHKGGGKSTRKRKRRKRKQSKQSKQRGGKSIHKHHTNIHHLKIHPSFDMTETLQRLQEKAGSTKPSRHQYYTGRIVLKKIKHTSNS